MQPFGMVRRAAIERRAQTPPPPPPGGSAATARCSRLSACRQANTSPTPGARPAAATTNHPAQGGHGHEPGQAAAHLQHQRLLCRGRRGALLAGPRSPEARSDSMAVIGSSGSSGGCPGSPDAPTEHQGRQPPPARARPRLFHQAVLPSLLPSLPLAHAARSPRLPAPCVRCAPRWARAAWTS